MTDLERAVRWMRALPRSQFDLFLALANDSYKRGEEAGAIAKAREADELRAENERLRGTVRGLIALVIDAGLTDDLVAQLYPDAKRKNGQPACDFAKRVRRTINEARAALGEKQ